MTETEPVYLASHPKRRHSGYTLSGLPDDEVNVLLQREIAEMKSEQQRQKNIRRQENRQSMAMIRARFGWINIGIAISALAIVAILVSGCQSPGAAYAAKYDAARQATTDNANPVPGMAERIESNWRPSPSYWRQLGASRQTRTIHCSTMTGGRITTTRCR